MTRSRPLFSFTARQGLDVRAEHDVFDEQGRSIGFVRQDFAASLLRPTWHLAVPRLEATGQERRPGIAILRRVWDFVPYLGDVWVPFGRRPCATVTPSPWSIPGSTSGSRLRSQWHLTHCRAGRTG